MLARLHPAGSFGEQQQEFVLTSRQLPALPAYAHLAGRAVDVQGTEAQDPVGLAGSTPRTPQDGRQAGQKLARVEGFGQVVVGADLKPDDAIHVVPARGQHQDGHLRAGAHAAAHLQAIDAGQHHIQDDRVVVGPALRQQPRLAVATDVDLVAARAQIVAEHFHEAGVVVDEKHACRHGAGADRTGHEHSRSDQAERVV